MASKIYTSVYTTQFNTVIEKQERSKAKQTQYIVQLSTSGYYIKKIYFDIRSGKYFRTDIEDSLCYTK